MFISQLLSQTSCVMLGKSLHLSEPITMNTDRNGKSTARWYVTEPNFLQLKSVSKIPAFSLCWQLALNTFHVTFMQLH